MVYLVVQADPHIGEALPAGLDEAAGRFGGERPAGRAPDEGYLAVFARAADAVSAARYIRERLPATHLRMAIHTADVDRCLQVAALGHGGQTLLSAAAAAAAGLLEAEQRSLGRQRLRDLRSVETVVELLPSPPDAEPLRSLDAAPHNLPVQPTSFVGRRREMAQLRRLLGTERLVTLTGPGGNGKTRMALQVGADLLERFPHGVWLVELAGVTDGNLVERAAAAALGLREEPVRPLLDTLAAHLAEKELLLLLDNCEHLIAAAARLAGHLLGACPRLRLLATSREPLAIAGETMWPMPALPPGSEAVQLFAERAQAVSPSFAVTPENAPLVTDLCRRLDGIPLAIELAAARTRVLTVEQIAQRLDQRLRLLTAGDRSAPARHQTLRGAIDWSHELLAEQERVLWRRLAVFTGGFALEAAEAVGGADDVLDLLTQLVDKSLVVAEEQKGEKRFRLLETMREYGLERLREAGEEELLRTAHRDWFLGLAEQAEPHLSGNEQAHWLDRLELEHDNLRQALQWSLDAGQAGCALRLGAALWRFWYVRGYFSENRERLARLVALAGSADSLQARARVLNGAGGMFFYLGEVTQARAYMEQSLSAWRELGDLGGQARALNNLGVFALACADFEAARSYLTEALEICRATGNRTAESWTLDNLGTTYDELGDAETARRLIEDGLAIQREHGDRWGEAMSNQYLGYGALRAGDLTAARQYFETALALRRALGDRWGTAGSLGALGDTAFSQGDREGARALHTESLRLRKELGDLLGLVQSLETFAAIAAAQGRAELALQLAGGAAGLRRRVGAPLSEYRRALVEQRIAPARVALDSFTGEAASAAGGRMSLPELIEAALSLPAQAPVRPPAVAPQAAAPAPAGAIGKLTPREAEIIRWVAAGLTAKEIGVKLHLSARTIEKHEENIRMKLDVPNRAALVAWAARQGLVS